MKATEQFYYKIIKNKLSINLIHHLSLKKSVTEKTLNQQDFEIESMFFNAHCKIYLKVHATVNGR
jgi:hypothetical protein